MTQSSIPLIHYTGSPDLFTTPQFREGVHVKELTTEDTSIITQCIDLFNSELTWDGMFDLDTAIFRFNKNHRMFALMYNDQVLGHTWFDDSYMYNFFVSETRVEGDSKDFCHYVCKLIGKEITGHIDVFNTKSQKFFEDIGFTRIIS